MSAGQALAGKRIVITRARSQSRTLADALGARGAEVLTLPAIEFLPPESYGHLDSLLQDIASFQWLIVTSANGAAALADRLAWLQIPKDRLHHLQIVAVGPATAVALGHMGLTVTATPEQYVAEGVIALLRDRVAGQRILLARAAVARDVIPEQLRRCGADIHVAEAYRTVVPADSIPQVHALFAKDKPLPDAVTFTSSSTVNNFFTLLGSSGVEPPPGLHAVSIGPVTSRTLRQHHWEPAAEAVAHDIPGLVEACVKLLTPASPFRSSIAHGL